jgi:hypothetical protein
MEFCIDYFCGSNRRIFEQNDAFVEQVKKDRERFTKTSDLLKNYLKENNKNDT